MRCLKCSGVEDKVIDSRLSKDGGTIRRRRECLQCGYRFTTYEQIENHSLYVVKRDQRRELFERDKILQGMLKACEKRPISREAIEQSIEDISAELQALNLKELPTRRIGLLVMQKLRQLDEIAYVRYASIYRQFEDVGEFIDEIAAMEKSPGASVQQPELFRQREIEKLQAHLPKS